MTDTDASIAADVGNFIARCIDSVPQLEGLLLLWKSAPQRWSEAEIAARIYVTQQVARQVVHDLEHHGFIIRSGDSSETFIFNSNSEVAPLMPALARTYCSRLVAVTRLIHAKH